MPEDLPFAQFVIGHLDRSNTSLPEDHPEDQQNENANGNYGHKEAIPKVIDRLTSGLTAGGAWIFIGPAHVATVGAFKCKHGPLLGEQHLNAQLNWRPARGASVLKRLLGATS